MTHDESGRNGSNCWPYRMWQFWCGLLAGVGVGLLLGAALVEVALLTPQSKAWVSVLGILVFGVGCVVGWNGQRRSRERALAERS